MVIGDVELGIMVGVVLGFFLVAGRVAALGSLSLVELHVIEHILVVDVVCVVIEGFDF